MFQTAGKKIDEFSHINLSAPIPIIEILCPICGNDRVEPLSNEVDTWECCACGFQWEII